MSNLGPIHNSQIRAARRCLKQYKYNYVERIEPKRQKLPLARGIWIHYCLQAERIVQGLEKQSLLQIPETIEVDGVGKVEIIEEGGYYFLSHRMSDDSGTIREPLGWRGMLRLLTGQLWTRLFDEEKEDYTEGG